MTQNETEILLGMETFLKSILAEYENVPEDTGQARTDIEKGWKECAEATLGILQVLKGAGDFKITDENGVPVVGE